MHSPTIAFDKTKTLNRWWTFIRERFPLVEHAVSIFCLTLANSVVACAITARDFNSYNFCIAYTVCLLFFFRLRCFDEIKDYATDKLVNPARPLARGLISQGDVKRMFVLLTLAEMVLVSLLGASALLAHSIAVVYSYLMYKEFFIGKYLSPHLTTYALTHTFVSVLVAYSIFSQLTGTGVDRFTVELVVFGLASWAIFNLFEFARKTYAPLEERNNVATYTTTFGSVGAVVLSLSQIAASILVIVYLYRHNTIFDLTNIYYYLVAASVPVLSGILFLIRETPGSARLFRATCAVYLIAYYGLVAYQGFTSHNVFHSA